MKDRMKCVEDEESWGFSKVPVACMFLGESDSCFIHTNKEVAGKEPSTFHIHPGFLLNGKTKIRISTKKCNKYIQIHVLLKHHSEIFEQSHIFSKIRCTLFVDSKNPTCTSNWMVKQMQILRLRERLHWSSWWLHDFWGIQNTNILQMSSEKKQGYLRYMGDEILPGYEWIIMNHYRDPHETIGIMESKLVTFHFSWLMNVNDRILFEWLPKQSPYSSRIYNNKAGF